MSTIKIANHNGEPEIFHSFQGEGKNIGTPAIFVRLSLCNLYCVWCDTDYTWNWENTNYPHVNDDKTGYQKFKKADNILNLSAQDILKVIKKHNCKNVIITGGEPLVQHKQLTEVFQLLKDEDYHIEIETNGTIIPNSELDELTDQYNVSIKLSNSKVHDNDRLVRHAIEFFRDSKKSNFKFVVDSREDLEEVLDLTKTYAIEKKRVYLMPQGTTKEMLLEREKWLRSECERIGFNYTTRKHVELFGDRRGV